MELSREMSREKCRLISAREIIHLLSTQILSIEFDDYIHKDILPARTETKLYYILVKNR